MSVEDETRDELGKAIRKANALPWAKVREKTLWDALYFIASLLNVTIERKE